jgi:hypothetical protein
VNDQYLDKNYGGVLVIWDRLFGTFAEENEPCVYGTRTQLRSWDPIWAILTGYWYIARLARQTRHWPDKLRLWFKPPGWLPEDLKARSPEPDFDLKEAGRVYDPPLSRRTRGLAVVQFSVLMAASALYLWSADDLSYGLTLLVTGLIIAGLWSLGALLQGRITAVHVLLVNLAGLAITLWTFK